MKSNQSVNERELRKEANCQITVAVVAVAIAVAVSFFVCRFSISLIISNQNDIFCLTKS